VLLSRILDQIYVRLKRMSRARFELKSIVSDLANLCGIATGGRDVTVQPDGLDQNRTICLWLSP
jgi:hypothetical protein